MEKEIIIACMKGTLIPLQESKDQAFAQGLSGDGFIIQPKENKIVSPIDGQVVIVFETKHAIILRGNNGLAMIIHIGTETSKLDGQGFHVYVQDGQHINKGDLLMELDRECLNQKGYDVDAHVLFPSLGIRRIEDIQYGEVEILQEIAGIQ